MNPLTGIFPGEASAAVSLTYDDGLDSHLDVVIPDLDSAGLRGTFFVPTRFGGPDPCFARRIAAWRSAEERGHEIGNHTQHHPCAGQRDWLKPNFRLEAYSLARMESELLGANTDLQRALGSTGPRSFAYPCGEEHVGPERTSYRPMVARLFPAARGVGAAADGGRVDPAADPFECDLASVPCAVYTRTKPLDWLTLLVDDAIERRQWVVFCFHGVGPGRGEFDLNPADHRQLCQHIAGRVAAGALSCGTFGGVAAHVRTATRRTAWPAR